MVNNSALDLYTEEQILLVLDYVDTRINNGIDNNNDYWLNAEWLIEGNIKENIKYFNFLYKKLSKEG